MTEDTDTTDTENGSSSDNSQEPGGDNQAIMTGMAALAQTMQTIQGSVESLTSRVDELGQLDDEEPESSNSYEPPSDDDLEQMTRADFADTLTSGILKQVETLVNGQLKPIADAVNGVQTHVRNSDSKADVAKVMAQKGNEDFGDFREEMIGLAKEHKSLGAADLLALARSQNPEKAAKMRKKYAPKGNNGDPQPSFGGFSPGGQGRSAPSNMKPNEAANVAWEDTMSGLEEALQNIPTG